MYNQKDIEFPSHSKDWRKFEWNNKTIALNILFLPYKKNTSKQNNTKKQTTSRIILKNKIMSEIIILKT